MKILPPDEKFSPLPTQQLIDNINDSSLIVRARIITVLGTRLNESPLIFKEIRDAIINPVNKQARVMGLTSVSWFGIITVLENGTVAQKADINHIMSSWDTQDKQDIIHYLNDFPEYIKHLS